MLLDSVIYYTYMQNVLENIISVEL